MINGHTCEVCGEPGGCELTATDKQGRQQTTKLCADCLRILMEELRTHGQLLADQTSAEPPDGERENFKRNPQDLG